MNTGSFLQKIVEATEVRIALRKKNLSLAALRMQFDPLMRPLNFLSAFSGAKDLCVIAEVKAKSPSQGVLKESLDPVEIALAYQETGAVAVSVLTEPAYFGGDIENLDRIRAKAPLLPLLQKDFIVDEYQIYEAFFHGADAILLILSVLGEQRAKELQHITRSLGLAALVEVHSESEMEVALQMKATMIGVNNRDLKTLQVSLDVSRRLAPMIPSGAIVISESGIETRAEILELQALGYRGFLIGTSLMRKPEPALGLSQLINKPSLELVR